MSIFSMLVHSSCMLVIAYFYSVPGFFDLMSCLTIAMVCFGTYIVRSTFWARQTIVTFAMTAWALRLGRYLYRRAPYLEDLPPLEMDIWFARTMWTVLVSVTCVAVNVLDKAHIVFAWHCFIGTLMIACGFVIEWRSDHEKNAWHRKHPRRPNHKSSHPPCCTTGMWKLCRHPNYLGTLIFHWGCWLTVADVIPVWGVVSPLMVTFTVCVFEGGMRTLENDKGVKFFSHATYQRYVESTPLLFPFKVK